MERLAAAHQAVQELDLEVKIIQDAFKAAKTLTLTSKKYDEEKLLRDGAYTELECAHSGRLN